jgi:CHAT domain-containing protein/Tfp pilus assembly protein PilF
MEPMRGLQHLGSLERSWGNLAKALDHYEEAVRVGREAWAKPFDVKWPFNQAYLVDLLVDVGTLYGQLRQYDQAQATFQEALDRSRQLGTRRLMARTLLNLGELARDQGRLEIAVGHHQQALTISEEITLRPLVGMALAELGWDSLQLKNPQQAIQFFQQAIEAGGETLPPEVKTRVYSGLAEASETLGDWKKAEEYYRFTIESVEKVRVGVLSEDRKIGFWQTKQATFERAISLLHRLHLKNSEAGYEAQAFEYAERARARAFLDILAEAKVHIRRGFSQEVQQEEQAIFWEIAKIHKKLLQENLSQTETTKLERDLARAEEQLRDFQQRLRLTHPAYAALQYPDPLNLEKVQQEVLDSETLLLEFMLGEKQSFVWAVSKEGCQMVALPGRAEIERQVNSYRQVITSPHSSKELINRYFSQAHRLYRVLLQPIEKTLSQHEQLVIVPDGILHYLPFETLVERRVTRKTVHPRLLLSNHRISYASSASVLGLLQATHNVSSGKDMELLAYADPVFGRRQVVAQTRENRNKLVDIARSLYREQGMKLDLLPYTREEVKNIAALYPRKASKVYVGPAATEASVKRENLDHFNCLHFATHGLIDEEVPARSGVVLSLVGEKEEDGILQMNEIFNLDLNAELVVLSACQTGLGKLVKGEGLIGLTRAFMYAGASSVVVSLWNVRDSSTAEFMKSFYRHLRARKDKAEALRQAKIDMIRSDIPAYRFPYFWAPFVVIGQSMGQRFIFSAARVKRVPEINRLLEIQPQLGTVSKDRPQSYR